MRPTGGRINPRGMLSAESQLEILCRGVVDLPAQPVELGGDRTRAWLVLKAHGGAVALDKTTMRSR